MPKIAIRMKLLEFIYENPIFKETGSVYQENTKGYLYQRLRFRENGELKRFYVSDEEAWIIKKILKEKQMEKNNNKLFKQLKKVRKELRKKINQELEELGFKLHGDQIRRFSKKGES